jgi:hypothetical protein
MFFAQCPNCPEDGSHKYTSEIGFENVTICEKVIEI